MGVGTHCYYGQAIIVRPESKYPQKPLDLRFNLSIAASCDVQEVRNPYFF